MNYRMERIERLLHELQYEVFRGIMEGEIDECIDYRKIGPPSKVKPDCFVHLRFKVWPMSFFGENDGKLDQGCN